MQERGTEVKVAITGVLAFFTALWGWVGWLVVILVFTMLIDYVMGHVLAAKNGKWSSTIAWQGIWKKFGGIMIIVAGGAFDLVLSLISENVAGFSLPYTDLTGGMLFLPLLTVWAIIGELGSIIENADGLGANVPQIFVRSLAVLKSKLDINFDKPMLKSDDRTDSK